VNAIPDKYAQWDAAYVPRRALSPAEFRGVRGASGQLPHLPVIHRRSDSASAWQPDRDIHVLDQSQFGTPPSSTLTSPTGRREGKPPVRCRGRPDW
jgi:hypothetical protein